MRRCHALVLLVAASAVTWGACGKSKTAGSQGAAAAAPAHVDGTPHTDAVVDAWKSAGLAPTGFAPLVPPPYVATYCERGSVAGVDATICEYANDGALDRGQQQVKDEWSRTGVHTGVVVRAKRTLLSAVDHELRDPNGKTINQLIQAFRKL
jgi:hypothetical protein